MWLIVSYLISW